MTSPSDVVIGIDASASRTSVALVRGDTILAEAAWVSGRYTADSVVASIQKLLQEEHLTWDAVTLFVVGKGPGNYTGLRVSMAVAHALALPGGIAVRGVCGPLALLVDAQEQHAEAPAVAVLGDARRDHLWLYTLGQAEQPSQMKEYLLPREALEDAHLPPGTLVLSPEYERLEGRVQFPGMCHWIPGNVAPSAAAIARLASQLPDEATSPDILYMHPPVFVRPSYPSAGAATQTERGKPAGRH